MIGVVLDASLALEWFFPDASAPHAAHALEKRSVLDARVAIVPHLWRFEVTNYVAMKLRRREISEADAAWNLAEIMHVPFAIADEGPALTIVKLANELGLTGYDAAYLHLAMIVGEPLATLDKALIRAAEAVGVEIA